MAKKTPQPEFADAQSSETATSIPSGRSRATPTVRKRSPTKAPTTATLPTALGPLKVGFPIVGIGASAGGLEALDEFLENMPADTGLAFVVVAHQQPGQISLLPDLLAKVTVMPVRRVADGTKVEPNCVYVAPPGFDWAILDATLHGLETDRKESPRLPIDYFFRSLAEDQKERAICIVLSGAGTDGTLGLREIKAQSGMAMAERPQSAKYSGMPSSAIATGLVDYVLPPAEMPEQLIAYANGPYLQGAAAAAEALAVSTELTQKVLVLLRSHTGHDFSSYKSNTLRRRIERRMNVHLIDEANQYLSFLQENRHEIDVLFKELLISVTSFFRDPDAWDALGPPLRSLIKSRPDGHIFRAWVPGCVTGEEAYSLSILLRECMHELQRPPALKIFGTDLDSKAIDAARIARFPAGIRADVVPRRLDKYFDRDDDTYSIRQDARDAVIFAVRNVIQDAPFTKLDLISCRNLLIYMKSDLQEKLLSIFHHALKPGGLLFLGPSETIGSCGHLFEVLDRRWKIFRRKERVADLGGLSTVRSQLRADDKPTMDLAGTAPTVNQPRQEGSLERLLLQQFAPPSVVVNQQGDIIHTYGRTAMYLEPARGQRRNNILEMARDGLQLELNSALRQCAASGMEVVCENVRVKTNREFHRVKLTVTKLHEPEAMRDLLLVTFRPLPPDCPQSPGKSRPKHKKEPDAARTEQLERELQCIREAHRATDEESQTMNQELESLNEELTMVNDQLQSKLNEFVEVNNDLQNLLNSTNIATMFLDANLNIRRYTEEATRLVMLRPTDVGRPIFELACNLEYKDLAADCREVLRTLVCKESILYTAAGAGYLMRIVPYRTTENVVDGLVLTFVDIERLTRTARQTERGGDPCQQIAQTVRHPLLMLDKQLRVIFVNDIFCGMFQTTRDETEGRVIYELGDSQWDIPELRKLLEVILPKNSFLLDYEVNAEFPTLGRRKMLLNARSMPHTATLPAMIVLAIEDVTENRGSTEVNTRALGKPSSG